MGMAVKNIFSMFKHKLEEGSKLEAAKFQLAMGKRLGFTDTMMRELRANVYKSTRELMENLIKEWSTLSAGERSAEVAHILANPRSTDYELQAATFVMLKKHGTLYSGGSLVKHQGSFKFFERISGQKYDPNSALVQMLKKKLSDEGLPFREEYLIQHYFKHYGGKDGGYLYDSGLW